MQNFLTVGQQVLILFLLIFVGFVLGKRKTITAANAQVLSNTALYIATPCVIIKAFFGRAFSWAMLGRLGIALVASLAVHGIAIAIAALVYRKKTPLDAVRRLAVVFSNAGFMALPLQEGILGDEGVFYGTAYVVIFNLLYWTYGVLLLDKKGGLSLKKALINPGTVGVGVGMLVFALPFDLPQIIAKPIEYLAALNTPLPMLFIGYCLSGINLLAALRQKQYYSVILLRLLIVPVLGIGALYLCGVRSDMLVSVAIAACAPVAAGVAMFTARFEGDTKAAANLVALSTLASLVTMPVIVALCQMLG